MKPIVLDFESKAIGARPAHYPPESVGLAVLDPEKQFVNGYRAYGHTEGNNTTFEAVKQLLTDIWASGRDVLFHNATFDMSIIVEHFGLPFLPERTHDTLISAFLTDPYVYSLSLKPLSESWLGIKPDERDELFEWLIANVPEAAAKPKEAGAYISLGPVDLVGKYAMMDVEMTLKLHEYTAPARRDQAAAYLREMRLMPILMENERLGLRVDRDGMQKALDRAHYDIGRLDAWLRKYFNDDTMNLHSGAQIAKKIIELKLYKEDVDWPASPKTGKPHTDKGTLANVVKDPHLVAVLRFYDSISKITGTYLEPWLEASKETGRLFTQWNQVRGERGGTRTGRLSARPTLQTVPHRVPRNELPPELQDVEFPMMREFFLPDEGEKLAACDFSGQEARLFAHFEGGKMAELYRQDPKADIHTFTADLMGKSVGRKILRDHAKGLVFAVLYGAGSNKIGQMLGIPKEEAQELLNLYKSVVATGLGPMQKDMSWRYQNKRPIKTIGGRLLLGEPPRIWQNRVLKFDYKLINLLIQGSAADQAKEAMVLYANHPDRKGRMLLSMHDEIVITGKPDDIKADAALLSDCMVNCFKMDVPFIAEPVFGDTYADCK
jgi:DNA polymerase-1